jgi:hypothetical protein
MPEAQMIQQTQTASGLYSDPLFIVFLCAIVFIALYLMLGKGVLKKKEYKTPLLPILNEKTMKKRMGIQGVKISGFMRPAFLHIGFHKIASIDRYQLIRGLFDEMSWDAKNSELKFSGKSEKEPYDLIFIRAKCKSLFWRMLGMKKEFYILSHKSGDGESVINIDHLKRRIFVPEQSDLRSYGGMWVNSNSSLHYIQDMSLGRMLESAQAEWEAFPLKMSILEFAQAKKERFSRTEAQSQKNRYEDRKDVGDTTIT